MTTYLRRVAGRPRFILIASGAVSLATIVIGRAFDLNRTEWPGWVQAIGSVLAILVAVWVSWQQAETQREREEVLAQEELAGLMRAIRTEVEFVAKQAQDVLGPDLEALTSGDPYLCTFPIQEDPFDIYNAALPRLGLIHDNALLAQIVQTYAKSKGFVLTLRFHNDLVATYERARDKNELYQNQGTLAQFDRSVNELTAYSIVLRDQYLTMKDATDKLTPLLQRF